MQKIGAYPTLNALYMNDPTYKGGVSGNELLEELLDAGSNILSWEYVSIRVTPKEKWNSAKCGGCGEMVPENTLENRVCRACGNMAYYDSAPTVKN